MIKRNNTVKKNIEDAAIHIGTHKVGYRAKKNGIQGVAYMKGDEYEFEECSSFIPKIYSGPCLDFNNMTL